MLTTAGDHHRYLGRRLPGRDVIIGLGGNDVIRGGGGIDRICGDEGNDKLRAQDNTQDRSGNGGPGFDDCETDAVDPRTACEA